MNYIFIKHAYSLHHIYVIYDIHTYIKQNNKDCRGNEEEDSHYGQHKSLRHFLFKVSDFWQLVFPEKIQNTFY